MKNISAIIPTKHKLNVYRLFVFKRINQLLRRIYKMKLHVQNFQTLLIRSIRFLLDRFIIMMAHEMPSYWSQSSLSQLNSSSISSQPTITGMLFMLKSAKSATKDSRDNIKSAALKSYAAYNPSKARDPSCTPYRITRILKGPCSSLSKQS